MAITLQITDGTDTVDFNDGSTLYLGSAFQMNVGEGAVNELIISGWSQTATADTKATTSKKFNRLIRKAIAHYRERRIDRAVWLVWKPDDQTDTQYAKVMGGGEIEIVSDTIGGRGGGTFAPEVIREGMWRDTAPDGTAGTSVVTARTIYNKDDVDGNNEADVPSTQTNDAPAMLKITVDVGSMGTLPDIMTIGMKRGASTTELNKVTTHFNPADLVSNGGGSQAADTNAAGDFRLEITGDGSPYWEIADTDIEVYVGTYDVYACTWINSGGGACNVRFKTDFVTGDYKALSSSSVQNLIYLGNFSLPGTMFNPFVTINTTDDLRLYLEYDVTSGTPTVYLYEMLIVPTDIPPFVHEFTVVTNDECVVDGVNELAYIIDSSGNQRLDAQSVAKGRFPQSRGGEVNRMYFFFWGDPNSGYFTSFTPNNTGTVDVEIVDRFMGLRGNT